MERGVLVMLGKEESIGVEMAVNDGGNNLRCVDGNWLK